MNDSNSSGSFLGGCLIVIAYIVSIVGSGIIAWNWLAPDSFFSVIAFLFVWGIIASICSFLAQLLCVWIGSIINK